MYLGGLPPFDSYESGEKSQSYVLTIRINQFSIMISNLQVHLKVLFIVSYNAAPIHLGYN